MWVWLRLQRTFGRYFRAGLALYFRHIGLQRNEEVPVFQQQRRIADDSQEEGYQLGDFLNCISLFVKKSLRKAEFDVAGNWVSAFPVRAIVDRFLNGYLSYVQRVKLF